MINDKDIGKSGYTHLPLFCQGICRTGLYAGVNFMSVKLLSVTFVSYNKYFRRFSGDFGDKYPNGMSNTVRAPV